MTIGADGTVLPSKVVFKGAAKGRIAKKEFGSYPTTNIYRCQVNAWIDKAVMLDWVDNVLALYVAMPLDHIVPPSLTAIAVT